MTFVGLNIEGAFDEDGDATQIQIPPAEQATPQLSPSKSVKSRSIKMGKPPKAKQAVSPRLQAPRTKAAKPSEVHKRAEQDTSEPVPEISLTLEEKETLKKLVISNM